MVTRAEFVKAVKEFKNFHRGRLKDLLNETTNPERVKAFWENPIIHAYLTRRSITFIDKHPDLVDSTIKEEHAVSDHYELKIYKYLPHAITYRDSQINTPRFYASGTPHHFEFFDRLFKSFSDGLTDIEVMRPKDIYEIAYASTSRFLQRDIGPYPRFLLSSNWKDTHTSTLLTILDPCTGKALVALFMNSSQIMSCYEEVKERYLMSKTKTYNIRTKNKKGEPFISLMKPYFMKSFGLDVDDPSLFGKPAKLLMNLDERALVTINYGMWDYQSSEFRRLANLQDIETTYSFKFERAGTKTTEPLLDIRHSPKIPFIDVSHHLQLEEDDRNCALYSLNFIQAMVNMLKEPRMADRVFELACSTKSNPSAIDELVHIFREDLKAYLVNYYDVTTGKPKPPKLIEAFHLNQRWELGGRSVSLIHPLEHGSCVKPMYNKTEKKPGFFDILMFTPAATNIVEFLELGDLPALRLTAKTIKKSLPLPPNSFFDSAWSRPHAARIGLLKDAAKSAQTPVLALSIFRNPLSHNFLKYSKPITKKLLHTLSTKTYKGSRIVDPSILRQLPPKIRGYAEISNSKERNHEGYEKLYGLLITGLVITLCLLYNGKTDSQSLLVPLIVLGLGLLSVSIEQLCQNRATEELNRYLDTIWEVEATPSISPVLT